MTIRDIYSDLQPLKTKRLLLRKVTEDDCDDFFAWASDFDVTRFVTWHPHQTPDDTRDFIGRIRSRYQHAKIAPWALVFRKTDHMIGLCGYCVWDVAHRRAELAYVLAKSHWGQGLMTEAAQTAIKFGFQHMNLNRIYARCRTENTGSSRVMEKCGMTYEGTLRGDSFVKGTFWDLKLYAILKSDWDSMQPTQAVNNNDDNNLIRRRAGPA